MSKEYNPLAQRAPAIKCENVGDTIKGRIISVDYGDDTDADGNVRILPSGAPRKVWYIEIELSDEELRTIYVGSYMQKAVRTAARKAGFEEFDEMEGAEIWIKRLPDGEPKQKGYSAPHLFECKMKRGAPTSPPKTESAKNESDDGDYDPFAEE